MTFIFRCSLAIALAAAAAGFSAQAKAQDLKPSESVWDADDLPPTEDISGIACVKRKSGARRCIIAVDEKGSALFAALKNNKIKAKNKIRLVSEEDKDQELDAEGAAYDPKTASFYVIGSYGAKRYSCNANPLAYNLIRIPVDPKKGAPTFDHKKKHGDKSWVAPEIGRAKDLKAALQSTDELKPFIDQCLGTKTDDNPKGKQGVNIEGLAILGRDLYVGLRGPVRDGTAYLAVFDLKSVFEKDQTETRLREVKLGAGMGVRDLAAVDNGLLILSGPEDNVPGHAAIHFFDPKAKSTKLLGRIPPVSHKAKPEALLLLDETAKHYRVLVLSDGVKRGKPQEFSIKK